MEKITRDNVIKAMDICGLNLVDIANRIWDKALEIKEMRCDYDLKVIIEVINTAKDNLIIELYRQVFEDWLKAKAEMED